MSNRTNVGLTPACHSSIDAAPHQLTEAKVNEQTNNNNTSANNKQTNKGGTHVGAVWNCTVMESSAQCIRVRGKASEMCRRYTERLRRYQRYIGKGGAKVGRRSYSDSSGHGLSDSGGELAILRRRGGGNLVDIHTNCIQLYLTGL